MARPDRTPRPAATVAAPNAVSKIWIGIAVLSLVLNAFLVWHWSRARQRNQPEPARATGVAGVGLTAVPHDLTPYAALGSFLADNNHVGDLKWTQDQFHAFEQGVRASYEGRSYPLDERALKLRDEVSAKVQQMLGQGATPAAGNPMDTYFATLREKEGVQQTTSGLHYRITDEGFGEKPASDSTVIVSYGARLPDGTSLPQLSRQRARVAITDLLPGLAEGLLLLKGGSKALFYLPPSLSFQGGQWPSGVPRGAPIIFFVELHEVNP